MKTRRNSMAENLEQIFWDLCGLTEDCEGCPYQCYERRGNPWAEMLPSEQVEMIRMMADSLVDKRD